MITELLIERFKCIDHLQLPLNRLTVLTGYNASGKSTSIQPLLLMAQALREGRITKRLDLNGKLVRLGTASEVVSHLNHGPIRFGIKSDEGSVGWTVQALSGGTRHFVNVRDVVIINAKKDSLSDKSRSWNEEAFEALDQSTAEALRTVVYIGATRTGTAEVLPMPEGDIINADVGISGQYAAWWFAEFGDDDIAVERRNRNDEGVTLRRQVDAYLSDIFPNAQANAEPIARTLLTRLGYRNSAQSDWVRPANTGYGLTHAFPLIVSLLLAKRGQPVLIDSPEAHLHPQAQSRMGGMLARLASAGVQVVIETHSDHVINGIRLAVKAGVISCNDVALHFFSNRDGITSVTSPQVHRSGALNEWPSGFFDQTERDLIALSNDIY